MCTHGTWEKVSHSFLDGFWPVGCDAWKKGRLSSEEDMDFFLSSVKHRVKLDLERMQRKVEGKCLPLKRSAELKAEPAECKKIKSEAGVKEEIVQSDGDEPVQTVKFEPEEDGHVPEEELSKMQLVELHSLQILEPEGKGSYPVHCPACSKTF